MPDGTKPAEAAGTWPDTRPPASLYVHVPFCRHRCGYCNFAVVAQRDYLVERYLAAVLLEMDRWLSQAEAVLPPLETVYLGGGTPTHLAGPALQRLVEGIRQRFALAPGVEFTCEANPEDLDPGLAVQLGELGINRISLGVQSLQPGKLALLERSHDAAQVQRAIRLSRGFATSLSLDLIFATPGEDLDRWEQDLSSALAMGIDHLSAYELTWEKGTRYWSRLQRTELQAADEDLRWEMYERTLTLAREAGLERYEISSFARGASHQGRHNRAYWSGAGWLAFGPGAASFERGQRRIRHRSVSHYLKAVEAGTDPWEEDRLPLLERAVEVFCVGLRRVSGVQEEEFRAATGYPLATFFSSFQAELIAEGLAERLPGVFRLTPRGLLLHDWICARWVARGREGLAGEHS